MSELVELTAEEKAKAALDVSAKAIKLDDVTVMGNLVTGWHYDMLNQLHHKLQMPADVGIDIPTGDVDGEGKDVVIDGNEDHRAGFLAGISYALELMESFPIKGIPDDASDE